MGRRTALLPSSAVALLLLLLPLAAAEAKLTISPANTTLLAKRPENAPEIQISAAEGVRPTNTYPLIGLTSAANNNTPSHGFSGNILIADPSSQLKVASGDVVLLSCDPYTGNIQPADVLETAIERHAAAVICYSETEESCQLGGPVDAGYTAIYSFGRLNDTEKMLDVLAPTEANGAQPAFAVVAPRNSQATGNSSSTAANQNALGPAPSTAVAMIILYSITGVITALFIVIIITGAIRAHRHPEWYGPRNVVGRPRQSRARGLARAMLDTIPIVKFGDHENQERKPSDMEMTEGGRASVEARPNQTAEQAEDGQSRHNGADEPARSVDSITPAPPGQEGIGGAAAANSEPQNQETPDTQGCSICTEDFEVGQDQRVLPCDHRFHPECVDPWLLNVSGTCPLCRIDLRPATDRCSAEGAVDGNGNPLQSDGNDGGFLAPPLDPEDRRRSSVRRSLLAGLMSNRPERVTGEERVRALRQYRERHAAREQERQASQSEGASPDEDTNTRISRLRNVFRVHTRRTGADGRAQEVVPERTTEDERPEQQQPQPQPQPQPQQ